MTTYLSVGTNKILKELEQPIKNGNPKPTGGLWTTIHDTRYPTYNPWIEFLSIHPHILFYKNAQGNPFQIPAVLIALKETVKIFTLENANQLAFLKKYYPTTDEWIDFEKLSKDYDGIFIDLTNIYRSATEEDRKSFANYAVSSLILFNLDCIKHYQQAIVDIEPFDYECENEFMNYEIVVKPQKYPITEMDTITKEFINRVKDRITPAINEQKLYQDLDTSITEFVKLFREKKGCIESPETLKHLLIRNITRSI